MSKRNLSGLIHEEHISAGRQLGTRERPSGTGNEWYGWVYFVIICDALDEAAPCIRFTSAVFLLTKWTYGFTGLD